MSTYHHGNLRAALIEAAAELARSKGSDGVVLREVARRTGVSHNAAYRHFADREALLAEVAALAMDQLELAMNQRLGTVTTEDPVERARSALREVGRAYVDFALAEPGLFEIAFAISKAPDEEPPDAGPYALLGAVLDDLVGVGALPPARRDAAQILCWASVHGFATLHLSGPLRAVPDELREQSLMAVLDLVERGLLAPDPA